MTRRGAPGSNDDTAERWHQRGSYCPASYKTAYRRIVSRLRERGIEFAAVWHVEAGVAAWDWLPFYPGDAYVDWIGTSLFWRDHFAEPASNNFKSQQAVIDFAEARKKPVLIAESSPNEHGVAIYDGQDPAEGERNVPEDLHACPSDATLAGTDAWARWFEPYFDYIAAHPTIKGFSYINNDWSRAGYVGWRKDARIGENAVVADKFQEEMRDDKYLHLSAVEDELGRCKAHVIRVDGADWLRFLPTGDLALSEGSLHANAPYNHGTPPVFAIVDNLGQPLLAIHPEVGSGHADSAKIGNVYLRGSLFEEAGTISPPSEAHWRYQDDSGTVFALVDAQGNLRLRGEARTKVEFTVSLLFEGRLPDEYHGYRCGGDEIEGENRSDDCECFEGTLWYADNACDYQKFIGSQKSAPITLYESTSMLDTHVMIVDDIGNLHIPIGGVYPDGNSAPSGSEVISLGTCNDQHQAKIIVEDLGGMEAGHLWLAGRVLVATAPENDSGCWQIQDAEDNIVAQINTNGDLVLKGFLYVNGIPYRHVHNYPFKPGGALLYE